MIDLNEYNAIERLYLSMQSQIHNVSFSGHETFPFRYGWLKKGVDAVAKNEGQHFFSRDDAMVDLGVGKNMVQSIRHWCLAANLIRPVDSRYSGHTTTDLGRLIFQAPAFDPYFEDPATLWLIHWQIASNASSSTTWYWLFNLWHSVEFTKAQLFDEITKWIEKNELKPVTFNSLTRDIDTCVRTYVHSRATKETISEDSFNCPLVELGLISELDEGRSYQIVRGEQRSLPNEILLYALTTFWDREYSEANSISLEKITYDIGGPGKIFKLDGESLVRRLEAVSKATNGAFFLEEKNGLKQLYRREMFPPEYWLDLYYKDVIV